MADWRNREMGNFDKLGSFWKTSNPKQPYFWKSKGDKMKFLEIAKDGGPLSRVKAFFLFEIKKVATVAFLVFSDGSREAYHTHAFHSVSWLLWGQLTESKIEPGWSKTLDVADRTYRPSFLPIITSRENFHRVSSKGTSIVLTFRGPWSAYWFEMAQGRIYKLTHGRIEV